MSIKKFEEAGSLYDFLKPFVSETWCQVTNCFFCWIFKRFGSQKKTSCCHAIINPTLKKKHIIENQSSAIFADFFQGGNKNIKHIPRLHCLLKVVQSPLTQKKSFILSTKPNFDGCEKSADQVGTCDPKVIASPLGSKDSWSTTSNQPAPTRCTCHGIIGLPL